LEVEFDGIGFVILAALTIIFSVGARRTSSGMAWTVLAINLPSTSRIESVGKALDDAAKVGQGIGLYDHPDIEL
jgi:hypothetical protein